MVLHKTPRRGSLDHFYSEAVRPLMGRRKSLTSGNAVSRVPFETLAKHRNFDHIKFIIQDSDSFVVSKWLDACSAYGSSLHVILRYRPPVELIDILCKRMADFELRVPQEIIDGNGKTPLHIAVSSGCGIAVIQRLVGCTAIAVTDKHLRYPLHWACAHPHAYFTVRSSTQSVEEIISIISLLIKVYPHAVTMRDASGRTPLQIAQDSKAHKRLTKELKYRQDIALRINDSSTACESSTQFTIPKEIIEFGIFHDDISVIAGDDDDEISPKSNAYVNHERGEKMNRLGFCQHENQVVVKLVDPEREYPGDNHQSSEKATKAIKDGKEIPMSCQRSPYRQHKLEHFGKEHPHDDLGQEVSSRRGSLHQGVPSENVAPPFPVSGNVDNSPGAFLGDKKQRTPALRPTSMENYEIVYV